MMSKLNQCLRPSVRGIFQNQLPNKDSCTATETAFNGKARGESTGFRDWPWAALIIPAFETA